MHQALDPARLLINVVRPPKAVARPVAGALLSASLVLTGCSDKVPDEQAAEPAAVGVIEVTEQKVNPFFEFVGKTRAVETVELRARVTGFLESRDFKEGGDVNEGDVLFKIEPERYQASLAQADAELAATEASLNRAKVDATRYEELLKTKNISQQKVDEAEAEVLVQEAAVQTAHAAIKQAQLDVDYTQIKAPIAGRIDVATYDVGNLVGPESGVLATINKMDPIKAAFSIAETWYLELVKADLEAKQAGEGVEEITHIPLIRLPDGSLYEHPGQFDFFDNKVDEKTGTVLIRSEFPNPDRLLLPGQFVTVVIERKEAVDAVMIPQAAVLTDQGGYYVLLVDHENKVESRRIKTGQRFGANLVVKEGLSTGDRIVLYGIQKVRPGITVNPELTQAPTAPMDNASATSAAQEAETAAEAATAVEDVNAGAQEAGAAQPVDGEKAE
ncbi:MAG: efflux RND transporter periplasmic adaptor subunit [Pseudomonadota bacterium]|nr:efflux RND transporter periplasmic adaptor subunit [Pseudomonadota bacterium]